MPTQAPNSSRSVARTAKAPSDSRDFLAAASRRPVPAGGYVPAANSNLTPTVLDQTMDETPVNPATIKSELEKAQNLTSSSGALAGDFLPASIPDAGSGNFADWALRTFYNDGRAKITAAVLLAIVALFIFRKRK